MIGSYNLSDEVNKMADLIEEISHENKDLLSKIAKKHADDFYEIINDYINNYFNINNCENFKNSIAHEVSDIITGLLAGDKKVIDKLDLVSEYNFNDLPKIRLAIWEQCAEGIETSIIKSQEERIKDLTASLEAYQRYR